MRRPLIIASCLLLALILSVPVSMLIGGYCERAKVRSIAAQYSNLGAYTDALARSPTGSIEVTNSLRDWQYGSMLPEDFHFRTGRIHHWNREGLPYYWIFIYENGGKIEEGWMAIPSLFPWGDMKIEKLQKKETKEPNKTLEPMPMSVTGAACNDVPTDVYAGLVLDVRAFARYGLDRLGAVLQRPREKGRPSAEERRVFRPHCSGGDFRRVDSSASDLDMVTSPSQPATPNAGITSWLAVGDIGPASLSLGRSTREAWRQ
ncbi:MAG: hypothetical protein BWX54_01895 [Verrucomicrobia bacterium ADurb.Bin018]|nr:MAG: hypothetical protein BWX54_01895 [Verrucomicrobia bacterium ADurb.Bin018]